MPGFSLRGKVALVTGAARGIGFETARLAHERGAWFALRGILNPVLDRAMQRDEKLMELVRRAHAEERSADRGGLEVTAGTEKGEHLA